MFVCVTHVFLCVGPKEHSLAYLCGYYLTDSSAVFVLVDHIFIALAAGASTTSFASNLRFAVTLYRTVLFHSFYLKLPLISLH